MWEEYQVSGILENERGSHGIDPKGRGNLQKWYHQAGDNCERSHQYIRDYAYSQKKKSNRKLAITLQQGHT